MGNAAVSQAASADTAASTIVELMKADVQRQMKELRAEQAAARVVETDKGSFVKPAENKTDDSEVSESPSTTHSASLETKKEESATTRDESSQAPEVLGGQSKDTVSRSAASASNTVSIQVPRNLAKLLNNLQSRVSKLEDTIQHLRTEQLLGDEALHWLLKANPNRGDPGLPYFVFDALDVAVDDDPFPALRQRPIQVLRVENFIMQEDRTARLVAAIKTPCAQHLCEMHFLNCEWDLIQASDVAEAIVEAGLRISVLSFARSQKLRGDTFAGFAKAFGHLRHLNLEYCQHIDDASVEALASECRGLRVVNLNRCFKVTDKAIHALVATNAQLHDVRLAFTAITDSALTGLAKAGPHLHRVEVAGCKGISNAGLEALAKACRNIVQVDMSGCDKVSTAGVVAIAQNCTALLHVQMAELYLVKDEAVKAIAENCHQLLSLDVSKCSLLRDQSLLSLARGCPYLQTLHMNECRQISDGAVGALSEGCEFLRNFSLQKCSKLSDEAALCFSETSQRLESLDISGCEKITDAGIDALVKGCDKLRVVDCTACYVSDEALKSIGYHCPKLESLRISKSDYITDWGMSYISDGFRRCSFLRSVDFSYCPQITDKGLAALCHGVGAHIEFLNLDGCTGLTNNGMFAVAKSMAHLKNLRIGGIPSLTSNSLAQLAKGCIFLEELFLEDCVGITKLLPILDFSDTLRTVLVCGITGATDLNSLLEACSETGGSKDDGLGRTRLQVVHWREAKGVIRMKMI